MQPQRNIILEVAARIGALTDTRRWVSPLAAVVGTASASVFFAFPNWLTITIGVLLLIVATVPEICASWWRAEEERENGNARADLNLMLKRAIVPLVTRLEDIADAAPQDRPAELRRLLDKATGACLLPVDDSLKPRSCLYLIDEEGKRMDCASTDGRPQDAKPFILDSSRRGKSAFAALEEEDGLFVADISKAPQKWAGSGSGYQTFITVPIRHSRAAYGLLTLDAPTPASLDESLRAYLQVIARIVAVAVGMCDQASVSTAGQTMPQAEGD